MPATTRHTPESVRSRLVSSVASHAPVVSDPVPALITPTPTPAIVYATSLAAITRPRRGVARNVSVIVLCRYSPATAVMPRTSVKMAEATPACASRPIIAGRGPRSPSATARPETPATMTACWTASSSQGPRTVRSLVNSLRINVVMSGPFLSARAGRRRLIDRGRIGADQIEKGRLQGGCRLGEPGEHDALVDGDATDLLGRGTAHRERRLAGGLGPQSARV